MTSHQRVQPVTVADVAAALGPEASLHLAGRVPPEQLVLDRVAPITEAGPGAVSFLTASAASRTQLDPASAPTLLLVDRSASVGDSDLADAGVAAVLRVDNARLAFARAATRFFQTRPEPHIHPSAAVATSARLANDVTVGPLCTIGEACEVGEGSRLEAGVHLYSGVRIGRKVWIHSGAVLGADGFGFERAPDGRLERFPHFGTVEIGDHVEIGANACIDRGSLGVTRIDRGVKIDNLVHVGHNVHVGSHSVIVALAVIGGSTRIGSRVWIGPAACIRDNVTIGDDATVGMGAVVTRDVPERATVVGNPARLLAEHLALSSRLRNLLVEDAQE